MKTGFIGHSNAHCRDMEERLKNAIQERIDAGCKEFIMGSHGNFDEYALYACHDMKRTITDIEIEVVITSFHKIEKLSRSYTPYPPDVKTVMYEIEEVYVKKQIIFSNQQMLDDCGTLICYVDENRRRSGAKIALNYAKRKGLKIINLFKKEDNPFEGMTKEEMLAYLNKEYEKLPK